MNWFDSSEALGLTGLKSLACTSPKKSFVVGGCSSASVFWVLHFWGLLGWCWLVGSSRTDSAHPFWWVISQHSCSCWVSWSLGSPGKYPCSWQPGTVQVSHPSAPQPRQGSALHKQKEWFCLSSWEFSVQRFKAGGIDLSSEAIVEIFGYMGSYFNSPSWTIYVHAGFLGLWLVYLFVRQALLNGVPVNFSSDKRKK